LFALLAPVDPVRSFVISFSFTPLISGAMSCPSPT